MTSVNFYELTTSPVHRVISQLVLKAYEQEVRGVVFTATEEEQEELNKTIWIFKQDAFIPHGTGKDGKPENQFFYLSTMEENPNNATIAFIADGRIATLPYEKIADVFDGTQPESSQQVDIRKRKYESMGFQVSHYRETPKGGWQKV